MTFIRSTDGTRIHYRITGRPNGAPILFIQGLGADKNGWNLQRLATAPWYRGIALDNRGAGRSSSPDRPYSIPQMAADAAALLNLPPDLNDGVVISIAPLWELVPWKEAGEMWRELVAGKHEWSTMAQQMRNLGLGNSPRRWLTMR